MSYEHVDRTGLYIMIIILLAFGPCNMESNHSEIIDRLDKIEKLVNQ